MRKAILVFICIIAFPGAVFGEPALTFFERPQTVLFQNNTGQGIHLFINHEDERRVSNVLHNFRNTQKYYYIEEYRQLELEMSISKLYYFAITSDISRSWSGSNRPRGIIGEADEGIVLHSVEVHLQFNPEHRYEYEEFKERAGTRGLPLHEGLFTIRIDLIDENNNLLPMGQRVIRFTEDNQTFDTIGALAQDIYERYGGDEITFPIIDSEVPLGASKQQLIDMLNFDTFNFDWSNVQSGERSEDDGRRLEYYVHTQENGWITSFRLYDGVLLEVYNRFRFPRPLLGFKDEAGIARYPLLEMQLGPVVSKLLGYEKFFNHQSDPDHNKSYMYFYAEEFFKRNNQRMYGRNLLQFSDRDGTMYFRLNPKPVYSEYLNYQTPGFRNPPWTADKDEVIRLEGRDVIHRSQGFVIMNYKPTLDENNEPRRKYIGLFVFDDFGELSGVNYFMMTRTIEEFDLLVDRFIKLNEEVYGSGTLEQEGVIAWNDGLIKLSFSTDPSQETSVLMEYKKPTPYQERINLFNLPSSELIFSYIDEYLTF